MIDEKGRLFGKVSIIDVGIILLALIIALGAFVKFVVLDQTSTTTEVLPIHYTLEIQGVRDWTLQNIQVGDDLFVEGTNVGTVESIRSEPYVIAGTSSDGEMWEAEVPDRYFVIVEVAAEGTMSEGSYLVSRTVDIGVSVNTKTFDTKFAQFGAYVLDIGFDE